MSNSDWMKILKGLYTNPKILETRSAKIDNKPAQFAVSEGTYETISAKVHMIMAHAITIQGGVFLPNSLWFRRS
jgi:hypothetical protein